MKPYETQSRIALQAARGHALSCMTELAARNLWPENDLTDAMDYLVNWFHAAAQTEARSAMQGMTVPAFVAQMHEGAHRWANRFWAAFWADLPGDRQHELSVVVVRHLLHHLGYANGSDYLRYNAVHYARVCREWEQLEAYRLEESGRGDLAHVGLLIMLGGACVVVWGLWKLIGLWAG